MASGLNRSQREKLRLHRAYLYFCKEKKGEEELGVALRSPVQRPNVEWRSLWQQFALGLAADLHDFGSNNAQ
jgi:hypothetical protein